MMTAHGKRRARSFLISYSVVSPPRRRPNVPRRRSPNFGGCTGRSSRKMPQSAQYRQSAKLPFQIPRLTTRSPSSSAKGYGLFLLTPDDLPRALQIAGEQFPAAIGTFIAYGHGRVLLSVTGCASKFSIAYISGTWQAFCAAFHAQTADFSSCFRMKLCLTGVTVGVRMIPLQRQ